MVAVYAEHRYGDVEILILIVYPGEPKKKVKKKSNSRIFTKKLIKQK